MANRTIRVELNLDDASFRAGINRATGDLGRFSGAAGGATRTLSVTERGVRSLTGTVRDFTIIAGLGGNALANLRTVTTGWASSILKANANLERLTVLLSGMSNAATEAARLEEANAKVRDLIALSQRAPFALGDLSDALVKLSAVGLPADNLERLTDAVAAFGGSSANLQRASVAIQQMSGKGVISLEELRQQLGEAIPAATQLMARAAGMSYGEFVKQVATGSVEAESALKGLFGEFERVYGGRAQATMGTWQGLLAQLQSKWLQFAKIVGDNALFGEAKAGLQELVDGMGSAEMQRFAADLGQIAADAVALFRELARAIVDNRDALGDAAKVLAIGFAGTKAIAALNAMVQGFAALAGGARTATAAVTTAGLAVTGFSRALSVLSGPVGVAVTLLASAAAAVGLFRDEVRSALKVVESGQLFVSDEEVKRARDAVASIDRELEYLRSRRDAILATDPGTDVSGWTKDIAELERQRGELLKTVEQSATFMRSQEVERAVSQRVRLIADGEREIRNAYNVTTTDLDRQMRAGKITTEAYQAGLKDATGRFYGDMLKLYEGQVAKYQAQLATATAGDKAVIEGVIAELQERMATYSRQMDGWRSFQGVKLIAGDDGKPEKLSGFDRELASLAATAAELTARLGGTDDAVAKVQARFREGLIQGGATEGDLKRLVEMTQLVERLREQVRDRDEALRLGDDLERQSAAVRRSLMTVGDAADDYIREEEARARKLIDVAKLSAEERARIEGSLQDYLSALRARAIEDAKGPTAQLLDDWRDTTSAMDAATADWLQSASDGLARFVTTGKLNFANFANAIISDLVRIRLQSAVVGPLSALLDGFIVSLAGATASTTSPGIGGAPGPGGFVPRNHGGGVVGREAHSFGWMSAGLLASARRFHTGGFPGLRADEVPTILKKGEGVFTPEQMRALGAGAGGAPVFNVKIENNSGVPLKANGPKFDGRDYILSVVADALSKPGPFRDGAKKVMT